MQLKSQSPFIPINIKIIFLIILSNIIPIIYYLACLKNNYLAIESVNYTVHLFIKKSILLLMFFFIYNGLSALNNYYYNGLFIEEAYKQINEYILKVNNFNKNPSEIMTLLNNTTTYSINCLKNLMILLSKIGMLFITGYFIFSFKVKFLFLSFIIFFLIKIFIQSWLSQQNPYINQIQQDNLISESYLLNIIHNNKIFSLFDSKNIIINRLKSKQKISLNSQNLSCRFTEIISCFFNMLDNTQWIINNILIVYFCPRETVIATLFNIGLTTYFYQLLAVEISYSIPALMNNYSLLKLSYQQLFENDIKNIDYKSLKFLGFIAIENGNKIIEDKFILKDISINTQLISKKLNKKIINIGVVGLSGSGKTSLLTAIMGFDDVKVKFLTSEGWVFNDIINRKNYWDNVMYISQNKYIFEDTLYNNLIFSDKPFPMETIKKVLSILNIDKNLDEIINDNNISGGEKSRINVARSILNAIDTSLIIIDELEAALDAVTYSEIYNFIMENYNCNKIISTHHKETIMAMDYIYLLDNGNIVFEGSPLECLKNKIFNNLINQNI